MHLFPISLTIMTSINDEIILSQCYDWRKCQWCVSKKIWKRPWTTMRTRTSSGWSSECLWWDWRNLRWWDSEEVLQWWGLRRWRKWGWRRMVKVSIRIVFGSMEFVWMRKRLVCIKGFEKLGQLFSSGYINCIVCHLDFDFLLLLDISIGTFGLFNLIFSF